MLIARLPSLQSWYRRACRHKALQSSSVAIRKFVHQRRQPQTAHREIGTFAASSAESTSAEPWSVYDHPELYDAAFSFRDFEKEVDFLIKAYQQHTGSTADSFLELGCGAANHAIRLAQRGHTVYALDISKRQIEYAKQKAKKAGAEVLFLQEDMCNYKLPEEAQVNVAMLLLGTLNHLQTHEEVQCCLDETYQVLKPGGMLIIELHHPEDIFDGSFTKGEYWEADLDDTQQVVMEFGTDDDEFDAETQVLRKRIGVSVRRGDDIDLQGEGYVWQRIFTFQEMLLLAESMGFEIVATYGDLDLDIGLWHPSEAGRMVLCLVKQDQDGEDFVEQEFV